MANIVIVGMQWGDEGKGKIVDLLCPAFPVVARYQGGHNAGHTVRFGERHFSLHLIPSGILHDGIRCYLGNGMVIPPFSFLEELEGLRAAGVSTDGRLFISDRAQVLVLGHTLLDQAREESMGAGKIGTTMRGIGPAYETKAARYGLRMCDLDSSDLEERLRPQMAKIEAELAGLGASARDLLPETLARCRQVAERIRPFLCDVSVELNRAIDQGQGVLFEGAQGTLLDIDHGTYPFVTSSSSTAGGACTGTGVPPIRIDGVIGILKAYTTRVGGGPFPTELASDIGDYLRQRGREFGTTTGRPRRCGWLDLVVARYARRINGIESIALTKLDILDTLDEIRVCVGYRSNGEVLREVPAATRRLDHVEPVYKVFKGWRKETTGALEEAELPQAARDYIDFIEQEVEAEVSLISSGPRREETILAERPRLRAWLDGALKSVTAELGAGR